MTDDLTSRLEALCGDLRSRNMGGWETTVKAAIKELCSLEANRSAIRDIPPVRGDLARRIVSGVREFYLGALSKYFDSAAYEYARSASLSDMAYKSVKERFEAMLATPPAERAAAGSVTVPREPTIEMENAGDHADNDYSNNRFHGKGHLGRVAFIYHYMLAAAPAPAEAGEPVAWRYSQRGGLDNPVFMERKQDWADSGTGLWTETPLYAAPVSAVPEGGATHSGRHIRPIDEGDGFSTPAIQEPK